MIKNELIDTAIYGKVVVTEEYETEAEARAAGYAADAHAYLVNRFGAREVPAWKVLAKSIDNVRWRFAKVYENDRTVN